MLNRALAFAILVISVSATVGCGDSPTAPRTLPPIAFSATALVPNTGSVFGATIVTVWGTGFQAGATVALEAVTVVPTAVSPTRISIRMPAHVEGPVDVVVVNPSGERLSVPGGFTFIREPLRVFTNSATGFRTTDLYDAGDEVLQVDAGGHLLLPARDAVLPGHAVTEGNFGEVYIPVEAFCDCWLEVRFGMKDGAERAYLTADYGHFNPGTLVDVDLVDGRLVVDKTSLYPPGTVMLYGTVTEATSDGIVAVAGAEVSLLIGSGFRQATTDTEGAYEISGLYDGPKVVSVSKVGYDSVDATVAFVGTTRFDVRLKRP